MNLVTRHAVTDIISSDIIGGLEHSRMIRSILDRSTVRSITDLSLGRYTCDRQSTYFGTSPVRSPGCDWLTAEPGLRPDSTRSPITDLHQPMQVIPCPGTTTDHYSNRRRSIPSRSTTSSPFGYYCLRSSTPTSIPFRIPCLQFQRQNPNLKLIELTSQRSILCFYIMHIKMKPNKYQQ